MHAQLQLVFLVLLALVVVPGTAVSHRMLRGDADSQRRLQTNCLSEVDDCKAVPECLQCRLDVNFEIEKPAVITCQTMIDYYR
jgi:hypothetical protein